MRVRASVRLSGEPAVLGTVRGCWQAGHLPFLPASSTLTLRFLPHAGQLKEIMRSSTLLFFDPSAFRATCSGNGMILPTPEQDWKRPTPKEVLVLAEA